jgi:Tfp pilus assembly protein PilO
MTGRDRMVLIAVVALGLIAAGWMLVVSPVRKEAGKVDAQVTAAKAQLSTAEGQLADARAAQAQYSTAYAAVVDLGKSVPASQEVPALMYQLAQATGQRNVEFNSIVSGTSGSASATTSPTATTAATAGFTQMPFTFIFTGGFFELEHLFRQLTAFTTHTASGGLLVRGRLLTIQSVKLAPEATAGKAPKLSGTITATAYVLPASQGLTNGATAASPIASTAPSGAASATTPAAVAKVTP